MLKNCFLPAHYHNLASKTCGEIVCQSETSFVIVCKFCQIKIFEFKEFVQHFCNAHWPQIKVADISQRSSLLNYKLLPNQTANAQGSLIKLEEYEEKTILQEQKQLLESEEQPVETDQDEKEAEESSSCNNDDLDDSSDMQETIAILKKKLKANKKTPAQTLKCSLCARSFSNQNNYEIHVKRHASLKFKCDKCNKSFAKDSLLNHHQHLHNGYSCDICHKVYRKLDSLRFHKETHLPTKNFVCDYNNCSKAYVSERRLNRHKRLAHILEANFVCEVCGSRHRDKIALTDHIRSHTGEKPFACALCNRCFMTKSLLGEHKACHETERKHVCEVCGKSFNRAKALYHHKHLHLEVKKFVCKLCGAAYAQAAGLSAHMRKHKVNKVLTDSQTATSVILNKLSPIMK